MKRLARQRLKQALLKLLERVANRILPKNAGGNNVSRMQGSGLLQAQPAYRT
jgi:hypothetical protein